MNTLKLSSLVGREILELRFHYIPENEYGLQSFQAYIRLSGNTIIDIPDFDHEHYLELTQENLAYFSDGFNSGQFLPKELSPYLVGQKITGFYFSYYNNAIDPDFPAFIRLSNNYYLTETKYGPPGLYVDLNILNEGEFQKEVKRRESLNIEVRSFKR